MGRWEWRSRNERIYNELVKEKKQPMPLQVKGASTYLNGLSSELVVRKVGEVDELALLQTIWGEAVA